jgi:hypothetical protein
MEHHAFMGLQDHASLLLSILGVDTDCFCFFRVLDNGRIFRPKDGR